MSAKGFSGDCKNLPGHAGKAKRLSGALSNPPERPSFHPLADAFPLIDGREFDDLVDDIREHGLREHIVLHDGLILDGRNRYRACIEAGVAPTFVDYPGDDPRAFVISMNIMRRHLDAAQKRKIVADLLKDDPNKSDRSIAAVVKVDGKTVAAVRKGLEATAEIPQLTKTTGKDGKTRPRKPVREKRQRKPSAEKPACALEPRPAPDADAAVGAAKTETTAEYPRLPIELIRDSRARAEAAIDMAVEIVGPEAAARMVLANLPEPAPYRLLDQLMSEAAT